MSGLAPLLVGAFTVGLLVACLAIGWVVATRPLRRSTVERFARRQLLGLVESNSSHVVAALLITHRWRRAGLVLGILVGLVWSLQSGSFTLHLLAGFLGWFAGAVVAEWRISALDQPGSRRTAALERRSVSRYVTPVVMALVCVVAVSLVGISIVALVAAGVTGSWLTWAGYSVVVVCGLAATARALVGRPSGFRAPGLREADDALRCHGLTVLAGSGVAAAYPPIAGFSVLAAYPDGVSSPGDPAWVVLILIVLVLLGLWIAVWSQSARGASGRAPGRAHSRDEPAEAAEPEASTPT
jgi:hypothetical protein